MTLSMPDSTNVANLPDGYPAYLGYADGTWKTADALAARFPTAKLIILTVTGVELGADGCDVETGDLSPAGGADWVLRRLAMFPKSRPVVYASVSRMNEVIAALANVMIYRDQVRLLSAHVGPPGEHICGPDTCAWPGVPQMDGTQWSFSFAGLNGRLIDMSTLEDDFFNLTWTEKLVKDLPVVGDGATGEAVKIVQGLLVARGFNLGTTGISHDGIDGVFGSVTKDAVTYLQDHQTPKLTVDGIVGPQTWPVLLGIAS